MTTNLRSETKKALSDLQMYGALYLSNVEPAQIEYMLNDPRMSSDALTAAVAGAAGQGTSNIAAQNTANIVSTVFNALSLVSNVIGVFTMGIGSAIGAAFSIIGTIVSSVVSKNIDLACDQADCLPTTSAGLDGRGERRHRNAIVGIDVWNEDGGPAKVGDHRGGKHQANLRDNKSCRLLHWGANYYSYCEARWGAVINYMNDGMWWWGKKIPKFNPNDPNPNAPYIEVLGGTVIGVRGAVNSGATAGCHRKMYGNPETPLVGGMTKKPVTDGDLSREFKARQKAVTQVAEWMAAHIEYPFLSCINMTFRTLQLAGGGPYVVREAPPGTPVAIAESMAQERSLAKFMGVPGNYYDFSSTGDLVPSSKYASRMYASIRGMFQALVAECNKIGVAKSKELLKDILTDRALGKLETAIRAQQKNVDPWPEKVLADEVNFLPLRRALNKLSGYVLLDLAQDPAALAAYQRRGLPLVEQQRLAAVAAGQLAAQNARTRTTSISYANIVRQRVQQLAVDQSSLGAGGLGNVVPNWVLYGGSAALVVGAGYLIYRAVKEDER